VLIGLAIIGFLLSFMYLRDAPGHSMVWTLVSAAAASVVSVAVFLLVSALGNRGGWNRPRVGIVLLALLLASIIRTCVTSIFVSVRSGGQVFDSGTFGRALTTLIITLVVGLIVAASVQSADERAEAKSALLDEQGRLRKLADSTDAERRRSEIDLWNKARELLEPTINEIRELIAGEISESAARQISDRIHEVVNEVVRPASRELARSSMIEPGENVIELPSTLRVFEDRMDITRVLKPGWLLIVWWGVLIPGMLLASVQVSVVVVWIAVSTLFILPLYGLKVVWPRRLRDMTIARGLGVLLILYAAINVAFQYSVSHFGPVIEGSESWASTSVVGVILRIALGMLVSVLAMLNVHSEQIRARLIETNIQLEELISRIRRETWLLHRVVSLAVHGTVQSALISTAMRLSAADRTPETVADARRRLEAALKAISADQSESASLSLALKDLQGLWSPLVRISFEIGLRAEQRLAKDAGLRRCVIEICREAASNAIRHGHAKAIEIRVEATGDLIEVHVTDDGDGIATAAVPGLGSEMLDDTCLRWQLDRSHDEGSELIAVLA
jgi:signal transduction histidine kinase